MQQFLALLIIPFFPILSVTAVDVHNDNLKAVLGDSVQASTVKVPAVSAGPGLLLPDSPLFDLDKLFQQVKLSLAFTPEDRIKVREHTAMERLSELRIMMARNNYNGINTDMVELTNEIDNATLEIKQANAYGKNMQESAKELNETIKTIRNVLGETLVQANGALKLKFQTAREDLREAKVVVEDLLPEELLATEVEDNLKEELSENVMNASDSAKGLEQVINVLTKLADEAIQKNQIKREEALKNAIEKKQNLLSYGEQQELAKEEKQRHDFWKARADAIDQLKISVLQAREAALMFEDAQSVVLGFEDQVLTTSSK